MLKSPNHTQQSNFHTNRSEMFSKIANPETRVGYPGTICYPPPTQHCILFTQSLNYVTRTPIVYCFIYFAVLYTFLFLYLHRLACLWYPSFTYFYNNVISQQESWIN